MAPKRKVGGRAHSSSSSGVFFSADDLSEVQGNSTLSSTCGLSSNGNGQGSLGMVYGGDGNGNSTVLNIAGNSGPSVGASSIVTDANSGLSVGGGPHLQRSVSSNTESYMRLPASPMSFSSNIRSVSGSPNMDTSSVIQQNHDPNSHQSHQTHQHQVSSSSHNNRFPASFIHQDPSYNPQLQQKKPRLDIKQEDMMVRQQQIMQPFLHKQESMNLRNTHPQLQAMIQQQRFHMQQEFFRSLSPLQRSQVLEHQLPLKHQFPQPSSVTTKQQSYDNGVCSRRIMQYLYHQRQRPLENSLAYWRKFVAMYYSPQAKQRWCFSLYDNVGQHSHGVFPQAPMDASLCHICGSKSGKGFVATFEALPRLNDIKFKNGLIDELLFLDLAHESRSISGEMMLEYSKAVVESVYERVRVVHEGKLRIIFSSDLKILSWEFCVRRHEEFLPRRLVAPQVNQLLEVVQRCQSAILEKGPNAVSHQGLQANSNMAVAAAYQLDRSLELQSLNELGINKRYARDLQISEVANGMKDLMDFCSDRELGPIDALKALPRHGNAAMSQPQNMQKRYNMMIGGGGGGGGGNQINISAQSPHTLANYTNLLAAKQISMNSDHSTLTQEAAAAAAATPPSVNSCNPNHQPLPLSHQNSNNGMQNNPQAWQQHQEITAINGENGGAHNQTGLNNPNSLLLQNNNPQAWQQHQEITAINGENGGAHNQTGLNNTNSLLLQNNNPQAWQQQEIAAINGESGGGQLQYDENGTGLKPDSNHGFNQIPAESSSQTKPDSNQGLNQNPAMSSSQGLLGNTAVSDNNAGDLLEDDFLNCDIDDYINFDWDA